MRIYIDDYSTAKAYRERDSDEAFLYFKHRNVAGRRIKAYIEPSDDYTGHYMDLVIHNFSLCLLGDWVANGI